MILKLRVCENIQFVLSIWLLLDGLETDWFYFYSCVGYDQRTNVTRGVMHPVGVSCISERTSSANAQTHEGTKESAYYNVFSNLGGIGYSILVPRPLALISFVVLILIAIIWSSVGSVFYHRYLLRKKLCWNYLSL